MKKKISVLAVILMAGFAVLTFQNTAHTGGGMPSPDADSVWSYITKTHDYTDWKFFPGYEGMYPGQSPHGAYLKLYANDSAYQAAKNGESMPDGAILVKENYGKDKKSLMAITTMYKAAGYDPKADDWHWAKLGADGSVMKAGKVAGCISCHKAMGGGDYVVTEPK